jgi:thiol-disulfide isomerase/thioredoxin
VLVDFWATCCGPCRMELPHFVELHDTYKSKGFSMIGISLDQQGPDVVRTFAKQWKMNYPIVVDSSGEVGMAYGGIRSIPTTLLIGRDGSVLDMFVGYRPKDVFEAAIKKALKQS